MFDFSINDEKMTDVSSSMSDDILETDRRKIANKVFLDPEIPVEKESIALAKCRRKFKRDEAFIIAFFEDDGEEGIAFTDYGIAFWDEDNRECVDYNDIKDADFDDESVTITTNDEITHTISCGTDLDGEYSLNMYNLICDCLEC